MKYRFTTFHDSTQAIYCVRQERYVGAGSHTWIFDLNMLRFCLLIRILREFRHTNLQKNNNWWLRLAVDYPNNPVLK